MSSLQWIAYRRNDVAINEITHTGLDDPVEPIARSWSTSSLLTNGRFMRLVDPLAPWLKALTTHVFTTMHAVNRFEGQTREDNVAMRKTFLHTGFVKEAHRRAGR